MVGTLSLCPPYEANLSSVIVCNKREAFVLESVASNSPLRYARARAMDCFAALATTILRNLVRQINPTGKSPKVCPSRRAKIFCLTRRANQ
jgi:hypothetical protein